MAMCPSPGHKMSFSVSVTNDESAFVNNDKSDCILDIQPEVVEIIVENEEAENFVAEEKDTKTAKRFRITLFILGSIIGLIGLTFLIGYLTQKSYLYHPSKSKTKSPSEYSSLLFGEEIQHGNGSVPLKGWKNVEITTKDGETLHSYMIYADKELSDTPKNPITILLLHGNAGNIVRINFYYPRFLNVFRDIGYITLKN